MALPLEIPANPYLACSIRLAQIPGLEALLDRPIVFSQNFRDTADCYGLIAWGIGSDTDEFESHPKAHNLTVTRIDDGFLHAIDNDQQGSPLSIVVDEVGLYYDTARPSQLQALLKSSLTESQKARTQALIAAWRNSRVSKYNHARDYQGELPPTYVLVIDQAHDDPSIKYGLANAASFARMLKSAVQENPGSKIVILLHLDSLLAKAKLAFLDVIDLKNHPNVVVIQEDVHPASLIEQASAVYCVTTHLGFEALLWGKKVRTFGRAFYADWGLTDDEMTVTGRPHVSLETLVHAVLIDYSRYLHPETGKPCDVEDALAWLALQRRMRERFASRIYADDFSRYKRPIVCKFFAGSEISFDKALPGGVASPACAIWGSKPIPEGYADQDCIRLEDGFIRSVGLGADLIHPLSWVMDEQGIYYDATKPSDLENILQNGLFDDGLLKRAANLRHRLTNAGLTKYNVGCSHWLPPSTKKRPLLLVPGQVETDASIKFGAPGVRQNLELLKSVRAANPSAYVIYKPHPDVAAGLRQQGIGEHETSRWCDEIVVDVGMGELLAHVDEVHTMTSLTGFEALLRGKKVTCYGQPFYAGWGLSQDIVPLQRRTRQLTLDQLVAGALILYPTYVSRITGQFTTPERALDELLAWREQGDNGLSLGRKLRRFVLKAENVIRRYLGID